MRMCTDDRAPSTSAKIRGKKLFPSTHGSIVAAVDQAKSKSASCGRGESRAANASVAASAPADVTASGRRRPARPLRDPEHLPEDEDEEEREHEEDDGHRCPRPTARGVRATAAARVAEKRDRPDDGDRCEHHRGSEHEQQAVGDAGVQDAAGVEPVLGRRPADHERAGEHAGDAHPRAALHRPRPEEDRPRQEDAQPAVVRPLDPAERQPTLGEPRAEHADDDRHDREPLDAVRGRTARTDARGTLTNS